LIIRQHITVIVALPGGGKTTFFYRHVAPELARRGLTVWYLDADSPASEHKEMKALADEHGFKFLNADANVGTSIDGLKTTLMQIAETDSDLAHMVFMFDTTKKFTNLMSKDSVKEFFAMCRKLTARGATIVLLAHANKYKSTEGHLIPEGVGDIKSDTDELIIFERAKNSDGGIDVTSVVDPDKNAKVRGLFEPFSFHISPQREITFYKFPLSVIDSNQTTAPKATDDEILDAAELFLGEVAEPINQALLVQQVCDLTGAGRQRVRALIVQNSEREDAEPKKGWRLWFNVGQRNKMEYTLPKKDAVQEQGQLFEQSRDNWL
jgi:KaiC/GvpD/RAD55 family RecA-like ATPase